MIIILPRYNGSKKGLMYLGVEGLFLVVSLVVMLLTLNSQNFIVSMFSSQDSGITLSLLKAYNLFYKLLIFGFAINLILLIVGCSFCLWKIYSRKLAAMLAPVVYTLLIIVFGVFINSFMIFSEDVFSLVKQSAQDIQQIESNALATTTAGFSKRTSEASMPGPYSSSVPKPLTSYSVIDIVSDEPTGWLNVLIPHGLNFELKSDEYYSEGQSISYNQENSQKFNISYTENFKLVVNFERVP